MKTNVLQKSEKYLFSLILFLLLTINGLTQGIAGSKRLTLVNVTFRVDMSERIVSPDGVHLPGTFCNWHPDSLEMLPVGNNIYQLTVPCEAGNMEQYKFLNGISWATGDETVPDACGVPNGYGGYNRFVYVPFHDTVLKLVCFSRCDACPPRINVTFRVSMAGQAVSPLGVYLAGTFNSWDPSVTLLSQVGNGSYYQVVQPLAPGDSVRFVYLNGGQLEQVPPECGAYDGQYYYYRYLNVPSSDSVLPVVCFSLCTGVCTVGVEDRQAEEANLSQNVPNPFGESSRISFNISEKSSVNLVIFDLMGRPVKTLADNETEPGHYSLEILASDLAPGIYSYRMIAGNNHGTSVFTKQMVVIK